MQKPKMVWICWLILAFGLSLFFTQSAWSQTGDVDSSGTVNLGDLTYLVDYLFTAGPPPPVPLNADVDGSAGINLADILQLIDFLYKAIPLQPYTGVSPAFSNIEFSLPKIDPGPGAVPFSLYLRISNNPGPDLVGIVLTLSYQNEPGGVDVDLDSVDFSGGVAAGWSNRTVLIDNAANLAMLSLYTPNPASRIPAGTTGIFARLTFRRTAEPGGTATCLRPAFFPPTHSPLLITDLSADGTPPADRVLIPKIGIKGDTNSDGTLSVSDVVYLVNYLFRGGLTSCGW